MSSSLFDGLTYYMVPLGGLKGELRRSILQKRLIERGAQETSQATKASVIFADKETPYEAITSHVGNYGGKIVDPAWISECITSGSKIPLDKYLVEDSQSHKRAAEDTAPPSSPESKKQTKSHNEALAKTFKHLQSLVESNPDKQDQFRAMAYRRAADAILQFPRPIRTDSDADELPIGPKSIAKVKEYLRTGKIEKEQILSSQPETQALQTLTNMFGVGPVVARNLIAKGFDSIDKLRTPEGLAELNENQKLGLQYFEDLVPKMPRSEVEELRAVVEKTARKKFGPKLHSTVCGSYRRGLPESSDADFLFFWDKSVHNPPTPEDTLKAITVELYAKQFLIAHFNKKDHGTTFLGICRSHDKCRRIDIKVWPREAVAYAMLYFTGSADFNRKLRLLARRKGFKLSNWNMVNPRGDSIVCDTEEEVFSVLGLSYIPPEDRTSSVQFRTLEGIVKEEIEDEDESSDRTEE